MKKIISIIIISIVMTACTKNSKPTLAGDWEIVKAEGTFAEDNLGTHYIFEKEQFTMAKGDFKNPAKTIITDSTFTWDNGSMVSEFNYHFDGDKLMVSPKGSDQVFTLEKK